MPRVGDQHARFHARRSRKHVAKQTLLRDESGKRDPERREMHGLDRLGMFEFQDSGPEHSAADQKENQRERKRCAGLETLMAVRMVCVDRLPAVVTGQQHDEISDQIRQRMNPVGDQSLRAGQDARDHLPDAQG